MKQDLLFEIGCEEIPAKLLTKLATHLLALFTIELKTAEITFESSLWFATPRRLAFILKNVACEQPEQKIERRGPTTIAAYNDKKEPTTALLGFLKACDITLHQIETETTSKGSWIMYRGTAPGRKTLELLPNLMKTSFKKLAIPKPMRWGNHSDTFIRPVRWIAFLFADQIVPLNLFGMDANRLSYGHRFMAPNAIELKEACEYETKLEKNFVIVDFEKRKNKIVDASKALADCKQARVDMSESLLNEVCGLVEWPVPLLASFDKEFLNVPPEALIASMKGHQKCFPLLSRDSTPTLLPYFITVSNIESRDPKQVIAGNEKVMRARLSDAKFFYEEDLKHEFNINNPYYRQQLNQITWQKGLGSLYEKSERLEKLAAFIFRHCETAPATDAIENTKTAALFCKLDLVSNMVGEFPELQGIMGAYYAKKNEQVSIAIANHYKPRFAADTVSMDKISASVALADKIDSLVGMFGIGQIPTGEKDPYGLRRAALGVIRIIIENDCSLNLTNVIQESVKIYYLNYEFKNNPVETEIITFIFERLRSYYRDQEISPQLFEAVYAVQKNELTDFSLRIKSIKDLLKLPLAAELIEANKRVKNILEKNSLENLKAVDENKLIENSEKALWSEIKKIKPETQRYLQSRNYAAILEKLVSLKLPIEDFFQNVMVIVEDPSLKENRLRLLQELRQLFLQVGDLSLLSV